MKKLILLIAIALIAVSTGLSLEPTRVSVYAPAFRAAPDGTPATSVRIDLVDYSSGSANTLFTGNTFTAPDAEVTADDNGVITVNVGQDASVAVAWDNIDAGNMNTFWTFDIYVNGTLFSQKRYDNLILVQAEATVLDNSGNFNPQTLNGTIGTDDNRWDDVYVGGNTLHIGPNDGDINNTEMELSYSGNTGTVTVDNTPMLDITTTGIESNGNIILGSASSSISNSASTQVEFADNIYLQPNNDLVFEGQSAILTNSTAPIRVEDDLAVGVSGGANDKFYVSLSNGNTRIDGDLTLTGSAGAGTRLVTANTTGVLSAGTALPTGTIVGTTDAQTLTNKSIDADNNTITNIDNADIKANAGIDATKLADGSVSNTELQQLGSITSAVVGITDSQTLTNKSIDADNNTITNIENADIKANAGIDATKLADGSVTSTELQYINSVTSNVQTQIDSKQDNLPSQTGNAGEFLTTDGTNLSWGTPAGGGSNTFFLEFSSFSNSSCCNDRSLNVAASLNAASVIFMNSTQPKPAYGLPYAEDLEVVSVSVYLNLTAKSLTPPVNFNVTPYIVNITTGATDRALTSAINLETLAEDQWHNIPLSSSTPADNLVDASAGQYVMWELNSTHGGTEFDTEGTIMFRVEVKYP